jgi:hypothetical protein
MFSIKKLSQIYNKIYNEICDISFFGRMLDNPYRQRVGYCEYESLTERQWQNLFDVCSVVHANSHLFDMNYFHNVNECGTSHCLAGWAVAMEMNDSKHTYIDYGNSAWLNLIEKYGIQGFPSSGDIATAMLSEYIEPFFYLCRGMRTSKNMILHEFILPMIAEGKKDGLIVSPHVQDFITKTTNHQS